MAGQITDLIAAAAKVTQARQAQQAAAREIAANLHPDRVPPQRRGLIEQRDQQAGQ